MPTPAPAYTYEERDAINVIRKSMRTKPQIVQELLRDQSHAVAETALLGVKAQIDQLLTVCRAFTAAASELARQQKQGESK